MSFCGKTKLWYGMVNETSMSFAFHSKLARMSVFTLFSDKASTLSIIKGSEGTIQTVCGKHDALFHIFRFYLKNLILFKKHVSLTQHTVDLQEGRVNM